MPDDTAVPCPHCGRSFAVAEEHLGRRAACEACGERFARAVERQAVARPAEEAAQRQARVERPWYALVTGSGRRAALSVAAVLLLVTFKITCWTYIESGWGSGQTPVSTGGYNPNPPPPGTPPGTP